MTNFPALKNLKENELAFDKFSSALSSRVAVINGIKLTNINCENNKPRPMDQLGQFAFSERASTTAGFNTYRGIDFIKNGSLNKVSTNLIKKLSKFFTYLSFAPFFHFQIYNKNSEIFVF